MVPSGEWKTNNIIIYRSSSLGDASTSVKTLSPCATGFIVRGDVDMKQPKLYKAIRPWTPKHPEALTLKKGNIVWVEREDNEYSGFAWCEYHGRSGWVPFDVLDLIDDTRGRLKEDCISKELVLAVGDELKGSKIISRWIWVQNVRTGEEGWVPLNCIEELDSIWFPY